MNLETIMSFDYMKQYKDTLINKVFSDSNEIEDCVFKMALRMRHPSEAFIIDMTAILPSFYNDDLVPKDKEMYDQLCTSMMINGHLLETFKYEEIEFDNKENFFKDCGTDNLVAYASILITEYIASLPLKNIKFIYLNYDGYYCVSDNLISTIKDRLEASIYPGVIAIIAPESEKLLEKLSILKDILIPIKAGDMANKESAMASVTIDQVSRSSVNRIYYNDGRILNTQAFKDSNSAFMRFLYYMTRGLELNSTANIKSVFECLEQMVGVISMSTLNEWLIFFLNDHSVSGLFVPYLQRLAALNNEEHAKDSGNCTIATFNYDGNELFKIYKTKATK